MIQKLNKYLHRKMQKLARWQLRHFDKTTFSKHPYWVESWLHYDSYGSFPNWHHPITIDDKLLKHNIDLFKAYNGWLKHEAVETMLLSEAQLRILCADKYLVRGYVATVCGGGILPVIRGVYDNISEVDFTALPMKFVLKMNNGSSCNYICNNKDRMNVDEVVARFTKWQKETRYAMEIGEWHYSFIPPKIICEEFLESLSNNISPIDYKFHCFNGKVHSCLVCYDRDPVSNNVTLDHYDIDWNHTEAIMPFFRQNERPIPRPKGYEQMLQVASALSKDFPYARVDLYDIDGRVIFGEITLTPNGNVLSYYEPWMREELGKQIQI